MRISELKYKKHLYLDMDGVLVNCEKGIADYNNVSVQDVISAGWSNEYWFNVIENSDIEKFFANLEWMPKGKDIVRTLSMHKIPFTLLTRPSHENNSMFACITGKKEWLQKNGIKNNVIFSMNKYEHCIPGDILIDDDKRNIDPWNKVDGIGLLYSENKFDEIMKEVIDAFK